MAEGNLTSPVGRSPLVSVVMPVYNAAAFVAEAIESILTQTHDDLELIVVDDGSTDDSWSEVTRLAATDRRVQPIRADRRGVSATFAEGVARAQGDFIARMDADDVALQDRLAIQLEWMGRKGVDVCGSQADLFGDKADSWWFPERHDDIRRELLFRAAMLFPTIVAKASVLKSYPFDRAVVWDDYELETRLAMRYRLGNHPAALLRYRRHPLQTHRTQPLAFSNDFRRYRFRLFYEMFPGTPLPDYIAFARLAGRQPLLDLDELDRAGSRLATLSDTDEARLRLVMAERWRKACDRSAGLGPAVEGVFQRWAPAIAGDSGGAQPK